MRADYVVVGAGSAGCVVASRLSETGASVILLEAGPSDWHPMIHIPAGMRSLIRNPLVNWNYATEPEKGTGERRMEWPRGRVMGGSSSINGMLYVRGAPADFDGWAQMGCRGWSWDDVLPYFKKSEHYVQGGDAEVRGQGGPLKVEDYRTILPLTHRFVEAAQQAGFPFNPDLNGKQRQGVGYSQMTRRGRLRGSTAQTFLREARGRPNLRVETEAQGGKLLFEGKRCVGVTFQRGGNLTEVRANREVIVSGGTINSPHILHISGIGPAAHLQSLGIPVVHDLAGVGANLVDHYVIRVVHRVHGTPTVNEIARFPRVLPEILRFAVTGRGALTFGVTTAQVFCDSREGLASPDLQLLFTPGSTHPLKFGQLDEQPGMSCVVCVVKPDSRGTIMAASPDPFARPAIKPNYLSAHTDELEDLCSAGTGATQQGRDPARSRPCKRRRPAGLCPPFGQHALSPGRHLQDGRGPARRGRFAPARARHPGPAGDRRLGDADAHHRQHQRAHDHDRRKGCGDDRGRCSGLKHG
jgi:choline dehydrogenase